jgi:hypothetical protein
MINEITACTQPLIVIQLIIKRLKTIKRLRNNGNLKD